MCPRVMASVNTVRMHMPRSGTQKCGVLRLLRVSMGGVVGVFSAF